MKKIVSVLLALALLLGSVAYGETLAPALTKDLVVLFTSDVHCGVEDGFGYAGLATVREQLEKSNHVLLVDNGDSIQGAPIGSLTKGLANLELMNIVGYDIATIGNHEFDYGMDRFLELAQMASFPYVSVNFTKENEPVFDPYVIKEFDGVQVAFLGVTTPNTITSSTPKYFQDENGNFIYGFLRDETGELFYSAVQSAVDSARFQGADYVVVLSHLGIEAECAPWMSTDLIANTTGIDALLDGHSHSVIAQETVKNKAGEPVLMAACGTKLAHIGYLVIGKNGKLSTGLYSWVNDLSAPELFGFENEAAAAVKAEMDGLNEQLSQVVGVSTVDLYVYDPVEKNVRLIRNTETNMGNFCADAYRAIGGADVGLVNGGGIRINIPAGEITYEDVVNLHPFGNSLCVVEATGQQILDALELSVRGVPSEVGGFLQVSGLTFEVHTYIESSVVFDENGLFKEVTGEYRVKNVKIGGEKLVLDQKYIVASSDYVLKNKGDGNVIFADCELQDYEMLLDSQIIMNYISGVLGGQIGDQYADPYGEGRIVAVSVPPVE